MLDKKDAKWWMLEAEKHPEAVPDLIRTLADRLAFVDRQNEELRAELISLRRQTLSRASHEVQALQKRIQQLESAIDQGAIHPRLLVYAHDRIEVNVEAQVALEAGISRLLPTDMRLLYAHPTAELCIITDDARAYLVNFAQLPVPSSDQPALLGNPNNVAAILDTSIFERQRFICLRSQRGYLYSLLVGRALQHARKGDKLLRHMSPDDPIVDAIHSGNGDIIALSQRGRWARFPENSIAATGSLAIDLPKGDELVAMASVTAETALLIITQEGTLLVRPSDALSARRGPGSSSGILVKSQSVVGLSAAPETLILTQRGKLLNVKTSDLPHRATTETGVTIPGLASDDGILAYLPH